MKFVRQPLKSFADREEKEPREYEAETELKDSCNGAKRPGSTGIGFRQSGQTRCAQDAVVVFGDALTAEITRTSGASSDGFSGDMIETALMSQGGHVLGSDWSRWRS
jgi:hypothetical protein